MGSMDGIRAACERTASALTARPAIGQKTFVTRVLVHDGLTCDIEEGPWHLTADLPRQLGGQAAGPTPGTFGRAALGSCLAICYVMWAARLGVPLTNVAVEVHADAIGAGRGPAALAYGMSCPHEPAPQRTSYVSWILRKYTVPIWTSSESAQRRIVVCTTGRRRQNARLQPISVWME